MAKYGALSGHAFQELEEEVADMLETMFLFVVHDVYLQDGYAPGTAPRSDEEIYKRLSKAEADQEQWFIQSEGAQRELQRLQARFGVQQNDLSTSAFNQIGYVMPPGVMSG